MEPSTSSRKLKRSRTRLSQEMGAAGASAMAALRAAIVGREVVAAGARHLYVVYRDGAGASRLTAAVIDSKLGTRCTARNWNTVRKLAALCAAR